MKEMETYHLLDESQQKVVEAQHGHHLVWPRQAAERRIYLPNRIRHARQQGLDYADMLCLTFTNRAAREMQNRIRFVMKEDDTSSLQVGNVHHSVPNSCSKRGKCLPIPPSSTTKKPSVLSPNTGKRRRRRNEQLQKAARIQADNTVFAPHVPNETWPRMEVLPPPRVLYRQR